MLSLKRWERVTYEPLGIQMTLKRLRRDEAKPLEHALAKVFGDMDKGRALEDKTLRTAANIDVMDQIPYEVLREWFDAWVKDVEGLDLDGEPITTGPGLLQEAHDTLRLWVLTELTNLSKLSPAEGKGFASRSASPPEPATPNGASPAPSTEREAGTAPSDATATTEAEQPSIPVGV